MDSIRVTLNKKAIFLLLILILTLAATMPLYIPPYTVISVTSIFMYIILTASWAIFSAPTRYISLASASFFGAGIYVWAILGSALPLPIVVGIGGLVSFLLALFIGLITLRLRGTYFIIFTFGFSEFIRHFSQWWEINISGTEGRWVIGVDHTIIYYAMLIIALLTLLTAYVIRRSKFGLALKSIGAFEEAAAHIGINVNAVKIMTFAISAFFMGAAGAVMATRWSYIDPTIAFSPLISFMPVLMAIFGGMGQIYGHILGAGILTILAEVLLTEFPYYYMLLFGVILLAVILFLPHGLVGLIEKWQKGGLADYNANT